MPNSPAYVNYRIVDDPTFNGASNPDFFSLRETEFDYAERLMHFIQRILYLDNKSPKSTYGLQYVDDV